MTQPPFRLYCDKPTKIKFDQIQRQLQADLQRDLTQDDCIKILCDLYLKDHPIRKVDDQVKIPVS